MDAGGKEIYTVDKSLFFSFFSFINTKSVVILGMKQISPEKLKEYMQQEKKNHCYFMNNGLTQLLWQSIYFRKQFLIAC